MFLYHLLHLGVLWVQLCPLQIQSLNMNLSGNGVVADVIRLDEDILE